MFDAHSHFSAPEAFVASDHLQVPQPPFWHRAIGLLPQYAGEPSIRELERLLKTHPEAEIGEVGLDRRFEAQVPVESQAENLRRIFTLALDLDRLVVLHCVREDGRMLALLRDFPGLRAMWHGFNGSVETARELSRLGVLISLRPGFGRGGLEFARENPRRILLESDFSGSDQLEYNRVLSDHYADARRRIGLSEEECGAIGEILKAESADR